MELNYPIPRETVAEIEAVTNSIPQVDAEIYSGIQHSCQNEKERKKGDFKLTSTGHVHDHVDIDVHCG